MSRSSVVGWGRDTPSGSLPKVRGPPRTHQVLPRPATMMFAVSVVALSSMAPTSIEKQSLSYYLGFAVMTTGRLWLHYTLWSERPMRAAATT